MLERRPTVYLTALVLGTSVAWPADESEFRFNGDESGQTAVFETDGPWLLDWNVRRLTGLPTNFEMRLFDAGSGEFVGTIAQLEGVGRGLKLFEEPGRYRIQVVSANLSWNLHIQAVDPGTATDVRRLAEYGPSLADLSATAAKRVPEGSFGSWRPLDDETLLLFAGDETAGYRVEFSPPCPGLASATVLSFVTAADHGVETFDSILLDDGTRCYFGSVIPTVFD